MSDERKVEQSETPDAYEGSCLGFIFRMFILVILFVFNFFIGIGAFWELITIFGDGTFLGFLGKASLFWLIIYVAGFIVEQGKIDEGDSTQVIIDPILYDQPIVDFLLVLPSFTYSIVNRIFRFLFGRKKQK
ncbi:hypothetical protein [Priestia koreensis]|uniref:hypothetical protein n=1 Tax=Priestia koreensis TaxID=284581 RepID=UPI0028F6E9A4|nr:hypothetical protein [Priestia koreensis]